MKAAVFHDRGAVAGDAHLRAGREGASASRGAGEPVDEPVDVSLSMSQASRWSEMRDLTLGTHRKVVRADWVRAPERRRGSRAASPHRQGTPISASHRCVMNRDDLIRATWSSGLRGRLAFGS